VTAMAWPRKGTMWLGPEAKCGRPPRTPKAMIMVMSCCRNRVVVRPIEAGSKPRFVWTQAVGEDARFTDTFRWLARAPIMHTQLLVLGGGSAAAFLSRDDSFAGCRPPLDLRVHRRPPPARFAANGMNSVLRGPSPNHSIHPAVIPRCAGRRRPPVKM
jgi:hypothetical protein